MTEGGKLLVSKLIEGSPSKWLHPYHTFLFNSYLALVGVSRGKDDYAGQAKYCQYIIEGLTHCGLSNHPELADAYYSLGEAYMGQAADSDYKITEILTGIPVEDNSTTNNLSSSSSSSSTTNQPNFKETQTDSKEEQSKDRQKKQPKTEKYRDDKEKWLLLAKNAYEKCLAGRTICFGLKHELTKAAQNRVLELTPEDRSGNSGKTKNVKKKGRRKK